MLRQEDRGVFVHGFGAAARRGLVTIVAGLLTVSLSILAAAPARAEQSAETGSVLGWVKNAAGAGLPDQKVVLVTLDEYGARTEVGNAATGPNGRFFIANIPVGSYYVLVTDPGLSYAPTWWPGVTEVASAEPVHLTTQGVAGSLTMVPGLAVAGKTSFGGKPQAGAKVCLLAPDIPCAVSGVDGSYRLRGVAAGSYRMTASPVATKAPYVETWFPDQPDQAASPVLAITAESAQRAYDFKLAAVPTVAGTVVSNAGKPVAGAKVCASGSQSGCRTTTAKGGFLFEVTTGFHEYFTLTTSASGYRAVRTNVWANTKVVIKLQPAVIPAVASAKPVIVGKVKVGKKLRVKPGVWGPRGVTLRYRWYRSGKSIKAATKSTYRLTKKDRGKKMTVKVTGRLSGYKSVTIKSKATKKVAR